MGQRRARYKPLPVLSRDGVTISSSGRGVLVVRGVRIRAAPPIAAAGNHNNLYAATCARSVLRA